MFRVTRSLPQTLRARQPRVLQTQLTPLSIIQRAAYSSKKTDKEDPPPPRQPIDYEAEKKIGEKTLPASEHVSTESSTTNSIKTPIENTASGPVMQNELKHDIGIIKQTFDMSDIPKESRVLGLAGTLPYMTTSLSTIFLSWNLTQELPTGSAFKDALFINHDTAKYILDFVEPIQLGYGAIIISFLGAIHWGLEYGETRPASHRRTRFRYSMGVISPMIAWPTLLMPVPYALTSQFLGFVGLYFADSRAATRGWAPNWYGKYRFMLTALVGIAIFVSLVGRQKIEMGSSLTTEGMKARIEHKPQDTTDWEKLEEEERKKRRKEREEKEKKEAEEKKKKEAEEKKNKGKKGDKGGKSAKDGEKKEDSKDEKKDDDKAEKSDDKEQEEKSEDKAEKKDDEKEESDDKTEKKDGEDEENKSEDKNEDKDADKSEDKKSGDEKESKETKSEDEKSEKKDDNKDESKGEDKKDNKKDDQEKKE